MCQFSAVKHLGQVGEYQDGRCSDEGAALRNAHHYKIGFCLMSPQWSWHDKRWPKQRKCQLVIKYLLYGNQFYINSCLILCKHTAEALVCLSFDPYFCSFPPWLLDQDVFWAPPWRGGGDWKAQTWIVMLSHFTQGCESTAEAWFMTP